MQAFDTDELLASVHRAVEKQQQERAQEIREYYTVRAPITIGPGPDARSANPGIPPEMWDSVRVINAALLGTADE